VQGELYLKLGKYRKALTDLNKELSYNPMDLNAYASRLIALEKTRNKNI
jgi:tetratricopeptide (TPR) repeat protein